MAERVFGEHIREAWSIARDMFTKHNPKRPPMSVKDAARSLLETMDTVGERCPQWDYREKIEALREAIAADDKAVDDFRKQFTSSGSLQSDPNVKYEVWN